MTLKNIITCAKLMPFCQCDEKATVGDAVSSSGLVKRGDIFFAVEGLHDDGHRYVRKAVKRGASAVVVNAGRGSEFSDIGVTVLEAADVRSALACALNAQYGYPSERMKIIAVTGTNGKTSISHMLYSILCSCGYSCGLIGTCGAYVNRERLMCDSPDPCANLTTPEPAELYRLLSEMHSRGAKYVVMEASSHAFSQGRLAPIKFYLSVFSNLTPEHLDYHKTMENYFLAKRGIIGRSDAAVVNADDVYGKRLISERCSKRTVSVSESDPKCDYYARNVRTHATDGISFRLCGGEREIDLYVPVCGLFNVQNALLAASAARYMGVPRACISAALSQFRGVPGRMQRIRGQNIEPTVFIDYAHTPDAIEKLILTLRDITPSKGRLIVLFGCGGDRDKTKRPLMGETAVRLADFTIVTSDNPRSEDPDAIISDILSGIRSDAQNFKVIKDRREAIRYAVKISKKNDIVVLAGKGHEKYEITREGKHFFDEEKEVLSAAENQ